MKRPIILFSLSLGVIGCLLQSCFSHPTAAPLSTEERQGALTLTGSSTVAPLVAEMGKRFEKEYAHVRVDVQTGGSSRGINDVRQAVADIGMVSRGLTTAEADLQSVAIAYDGITIILHQTNPITALTNQQIIAIFTEKITNWQPLDSFAKPITVVSKAEGRSTLELFVDYFQLKNTEIKAQVIIGDNEQGIKTVAGNPGAIGYVSIGAAQRSIANGVPIKLLPINGIAANGANVQNNRFPISRPLNLVTVGQPQGLIQDFIEYAQSPQVSDIVEQQNFVVVSP